MNFSCGVPSWFLTTTEEESVNDWMMQTGTNTKASIMNLLRTHHTKKIYLPQENSKCMTRTYLIGVLLGKYFFVRAENFRILSESCAKLVNATSELLFDEIRRFLIPANVNFGFSEECLPDKNWLLNVLWNLNPQHPIFVSELNLSVCDALKDFLPTDVAPDQSYKKALHPAYKKFLKLKKVRKCIKEHLGNANNKSYSKKKTGNLSLERTRSH